MESNRLTIIPSDGAIYRDQQVFMNLDLTTCGIPTEIHALQWKDGAGWIEYIDNRPNLLISEQPQWALDCVELWESTYQTWLIQQAAPLPVIEDSDTAPE